MHSLPTAGADYVLRGVLWAIRPLQAAPDYSPSASGQERPLDRKLLGVLAGLWSGTESVGGHLGKFRSSPRFATTLPPADKKKAIPMDLQLFFICFLTFVIHLIGTLAYCPAPMQASASAQLDSSDSVYLYGRMDR